MRSELNKNENCAVFSSFVEEMDSNQKKVHSKDTTWLFGKMYRRDFLERNRIIFNNSRENDNSEKQQLKRRFRKCSYTRIFVKKQLTATEC